MRFHVKTSSRCRALREACRLTSRISYHIILLFLLQSIALAQVRRDRFRNFSEADGFSSFRVYDVAFDSVGFLWAGTLGGLDRYAGSGFTSFFRGESVTKLFVDSRGTLWINTSERGVAKFETETRTAVLPQAP
jgi:ligand-binding sensor domain-containing protein